MNQIRVSQIAYLGLEASDLPAWNQFASNVLGLRSNGGDADGTRFLKMDECHHRPALHPGPRDDIAYAEWAIRDEASPRALAEQRHRTVAA